jgi:ribosomal-protein-alanine N-acetyltransferase
MKMPDIFETPRLLIQRLRYEDASEIFYTYASKPESTRYLSWPTHQRIKDTRQFLQYTLAAWQAGTDFSYSIRLKDTYRMVGNIGVLYDAGKTHFGYVFGPLHWGKGFATEACLQLLELLKNNADVQHIGTFVDAENVASASVLYKCGLVEEAHLVKWYRFVNQGNEPKDCILFKLPMEI